MKNKTKYSMAVGIVLMVFCGINNSKAICNSEKEAISQTNSANPLISNISQWQKELELFRQAKNKEFKNSATSPMAGQNLLKIEHKNHFYLNHTQNMLVIADNQNPDSILQVIKKNDQWNWHSYSPKLTILLNDQPYLNTLDLPNQALIKFMSFTMRVSRKENVFLLSIFNSERQEFKQFTSLLYYEPNCDWVVKARITRLKNPKTIIMITSRNEERTFYKYASLTFKKAGKFHTIYAYKMELSGNNAAYIFVPFKDASNYQGTYGGGRYLELSDSISNEIILDFNYAFNPLCNYAPIYNCAVPPAENKLSIAVEAGEKEYPHE
jgi:uncharacterized protein (DUF1684 family)